MVKAPTDVWYIMNWLEPGLFGTNNRQTFKTEYCILGGYSGNECVGIRPDRVRRLRAAMDELIRLAIMDTPIRQRPKPAASRLARAAGY